MEPATFSLWVDSADHCFTVLHSYKVKLIFDTLQTGWPTQKSHQQQWAAVQQVETFQAKTTETMTNGEIVDPRGLQLYLFAIVLEEEDLGK